MSYVRANLGRTSRIAAAASSLYGHAIFFQESSYLLKRRRGVHAHPRARVLDGIPDLQHSSRIDQRRAQPPVHALSSNNQAGDSRQRSIHAREGLEGLAISSRGWLTSVSES